jgi:hypothetical protein
VFALPSTAFAVGASAFSEREVICEDSVQHSAKLAQTFHVRFGHQPFVVGRNVQQKDAVAPDGFEVDVQQVVSVACKK